jgi:hypothetical protein
LVILAPFRVKANLHQTGYLQDALAACGWKDAAKLEQQDTSEAFSFITETLELPLLTLKMDIYHTGAEDDSDDHKFIQERLLEVAVPPDPGNGRAIQLEDCLENFFNNRVEVVRRLDRSNTFSSVRSGQSPSGEKSGSQHVEITELAWPTHDSPTSPTPEDPGSPLTPTLGRPRAGSIIRRRLVREDENGEPLTDSEAGSTRHSIRKGSIRKEVLMPAWQFFNLIRPSPFNLHMKTHFSFLPPESPVLIGDIAWYTKGSPSNDAEVAAHFSKTRPVLGICLKRYAMSAAGRATKESTFIDIPLDIRLPHFIEDDMIAEEGPLMGNFKLSLQSVICHRGNSLHSGHYVSFVRAAAEVADGDSTSTRKLSSSSRPPDYPVDRWVRHDDLSHPDRVQYVDIEQALRDETPYLLFYQVQPTNTYGISLGIDADYYPPSYDSGIDVKLSESGLLPNGKSESGHSGSTTGQSTPAYRFSSEVERPRRSVNLPEDRESLAYTDISTVPTTISAPVPEIASTPPTPIEETTAQRLSRAASRFARPGSRSRPVSSSGENRISATFSRMRSKDQLNKLDPKLETTKEPVPATGTFTTTDGASDAHEAILTAVNESPRKPRDGAPDWARGKLGRKQDKSKEPGDKQGKSHGQHLQKGRGKDVPDRECIVM